MKVDECSVLSKSGVLSLTLGYIVMHTTHAHAHANVIIMCSEK